MTSTKKALQRPTNWQQSIKPTSHPASQPNNQPTTFICLKIRFKNKHYLNTSLTYKRYTHPHLKPQKTNPGRLATASGGFMQW